MKNFWNPPNIPFLTRKSLVSSFKSCLEKEARVNTELMIHFLSLFRSTKLLSDEVNGSQYVQSMPLAFKAVVSWQVNLITAG